MIISTAFFVAQKDPLLELYRKPDPTLVDGQSLTTMFGKFPPELLGKQIEDVDYYYRNKKVNFIARTDKLEYINTVLYIEPSQLDSSCLSTSLSFSKKVIELAESLILRC